nr:hypothetical protein CTI12_AA016550, mitochondrial [Tanacetum cinerariifolium]
ILYPVAAFMKAFIEESKESPERNQDQQFHLTKLKQQIQAILGFVDQVKAAYRGTSHERPTRSSYFTPGAKQWSFFPRPDTSIEWAEPEFFIRKGRQSLKAAIPIGQRAERSRKWKAEKG